MIPCKTDCNQLLSVWRCCYARHDAMLLVFSHFFLSSIQTHTNDHVHWHRFLVFTVENNLSVCVHMRLWHYKISLFIAYVMCMCFEYSYAYVNEETIIHDPFSKKEKLSLIAGCMRFFYAKRDNLSIHCNFYRTNTSETHNHIGWWWRCCEAYSKHPIWVSNG